MVWEGYGGPNDRRPYPDLKAVAGAGIEADSSARGAGKGAFRPVSEDGRLRVSDREGAMEEDSLRPLQILQGSSSTTALHRLSFLFSG